MMKQERRTFSRRSFLKHIAILGAALLRKNLSRNCQPVHAAAPDQRSPAPALSPPDMPADEYEHHIYLPLVMRPPDLGPSKFGVHTVRPHHVIDFVRGVHDAGAHVALVKAVDEFGYLRELKGISPETVTIGRYSGAGWVEASGDPAEKAADLMDQHMPRWSYEKDVVDYWEVLNEVDPPTVAGHIWLAQFYTEAMNIAENNGYKLAIFSYSVGVPEWYEWQAIVETGVFARAKQGGHVLALHEYNYPVMDNLWNAPLGDQPPYSDRGLLSGRYRYLYRDFLIPRDEVIPLAITEGGLDPVLWQPGQPTTWMERLVDEMIWYDTKLREDGYVIGVATFTLGGIGQWEMYDYTDLLPQFHDHIVSLKDGN